MPLAYTLEALTKPPNLPCRQSATRLAWVECRQPSALPKSCRTVDHLLVLILQRLPTRLSDLSAQSGCKRRTAHNRCSSWSAPFWATDDSYFKARCSSKQGRSLCTDHFFIPASRNSFPTCSGDVRRSMLWCDTLGAKSSVSFITGGLLDSAYTRDQMLG